MSAALLLHLLEGALCAQQTPEHVFLVAHIMVTAIVVLLRAVLAYGTVCRCSFENQIFHLIILKTYRRLFCLGDDDCSAL